MDKMVGKSRFSETVLGVAEPAILQHADWLKDATFLAALRTSWQSQYADYMGEEDAENLVATLFDSGVILDHDPDGTVVATVDNKPVGIAAVRQLQGVSLISMLEVVKEHRGRGIGKQLVTALFTVKEPVLAHVSIHRPHVKAFYLSMGFHVLEPTRLEHYGHSLLFDVVARSI